ncbi:phage tail assembly chaperone [Tsuneonella mangrovi]|uniref:phage tail assembly chaperone n=1 Tax=Tsuneonella mangrovi TaxID=1982042 RepID=UPI001F0AF834|nr:phage tail assembly chaperone [Tsuneonella mangrovi]
MSDRFGAAAMTLCRFATVALGWRPHEFWAATPAELGVCFAPPDGSAAPLGRADLERLMENNPDG